MTGPFLEIDLLKIVFFLSGPLGRGAGGGGLLIPTRFVFTFFTNVNVKLMAICSLNFNKMPLLRHNFFYICGLGAKLV